MLPQVIPLKTLTASKVIQEMDTIFNRFRKTNIPKTDNGPPFNSHKFTNYMKDNRNKHHGETPLWPEDNGEVECFICTIKKAINAAKVEGKDWKKEISIFLKHYRATPHTSTEVPPVKGTFGRNIKNCLLEWNHKIVMHIGILWTSTSRQKEILS